MSYKFTKMPVDAFSHLQMNAGIVVDSFDPATGEIGNIIGATTGGISFNSNPTYSDFGEDVDNCPNNMKELKHLDGYDPTMSGTFLTCTPAVCKMLVASADIDTSDSTRVIPRNEILQTDFKTVWWIGDYSDVNTGEDAGYLAIKLLNSLNQSGFQITSGKNAKGQMAFEFHGHYSMAAQEVVPFEIYCKSSSDSESDTPYLLLDKHYVTIQVGETYTPTYVQNPDNVTVSFASDTTSKVTIQDKKYVGVAAGSAVVTASMSVSGVSIRDTCTVIVTAAS